ncbi:hypothetical protein FHG87_004422 [Trinorchestia longiramus]|nr:hypothetical protein FHG87_004422 [Trinorchestia longiramus]
MSAISKTCTLPGESRRPTTDVLYFLQKDKITSFDAFKPERNLQELYKNLIISRSKERLVCLFITGYFSECSLSVIVENKPTLCSPLTLSAFKNGISVPLFKTLHPNNGLRSYTQFDETVRLAMQYDIPFDKTIQNVVTLLQAHTSACVDTEKEKKLVFLTRQLELLLQKQFSMNDYCFALQSYPKCNYEQLTDFLVLPCKRKLQYITSSIDKDQRSCKLFVIGSSKPATGSSKPSATGSSKPSATGSSKPSASGSSKPSDIGFSKPSAIGFSKPSAIGFSKPSAIGFSKPSAIGFSKPSAIGFSKPSAIGFSKPSATGFSKPSATGSSKPSATGSSKPSATGSSKPSATGSSKPSATGFSKPSATGFSKPSASGYRVQ